MTISNFDENVRKLSEQVENTEGKGENACYKQFLLFPHCFQKICTEDKQRQGSVWKRVKCTLKTFIATFGCYWAFKLLKYEVKDQLYKITIFWTAPNSKHLQTTKKKILL